MKKYATISMFIFWAVFTAVAAAGLISYDKNNQPIAALSNVDGAGQLQTNDAVSGVGSNTASTGLVLSNAELIKHNSGTSCWLLISDKIYDVTTFLNQHPGNASTILPTCGTDATAAYASRGSTGSHSSSATSMLAAYYIGDLNQSVITNSTNPTSPTIANPTFVPTTSGDDDEKEDDD